MRRGVQQPDLRFITTLILILLGTLRQALASSYSVDVPTPRKATCGLSLLTALLTVFPALSQIAPVPVAPVPAGGVPASVFPVQSQASPTPPPSVAAGIFPLDQVHRGLHGVAYTVFEGTQPEPMDLEILGVLYNMRGPGQDMILARLIGTKPEYTGVVAGMSGSPVYIDGKLVGALAYRIGQFSKEPIAGITPIAEILQVRDQRASPPPTSQVAETPNSHQALDPERASEPSQGLTGNQLRSTAPAPAAAASCCDSSSIQPIETPLVFNGYSDAAIELWQDHASLTNLAPGQRHANASLTNGLNTGMNPVAGVGGSSSNRPQPEPIVPGSAVSAILVRGDLDISATCTVTYVDAKQLLACGHPITQFGPISMPMTKAEVVATLASPLNAFKIVNTTETVGSFDQDRESAIRGQFGASARMLPVSVHIHGSGADHTVHFEVIDQPDVTPSAILVSIYQSLLSSNNYSAETTFHLRGTLELEGLPSVKFDSTLAPTDQVASSIGAAMLVGERFARLYDDASRRTTFKSLVLDFEEVPGRQLIQIESANTEVTRVHAGQTVTIGATLRPYRGEPRNLRIPVTLPPNLQPGQVRLLLSDGPTLDRVMQPGRPPSKPLDLKTTIDLLNSLHPNDRLYVSLLDPSAQASLEGRTLSSLPISLANIYEPLRNNQEMTLNGESILPVTSIPVDGMLSGQQVISFVVE
ncbi:MAG TPA: SpoIVB peptidase S55 [Acidisarcina sp.]